MIPAIKIAQNAVQLHRYYLSIGVPEDRARQLQGGYFNNAIRDRQYNVLDRIQISRVGGNLPKEKEK